MCILAGILAVWRRESLWGLCLVAAMLSGCQTTSLVRNVVPAARVQPIMDAEEASTITHTRAASATNETTSHVNRVTVLPVSDRVVAVRVASPILMIREAFSSSLTSDTDEPWMKSTLAREASCPKPEIVTHSHESSSLTASWKDLWFDDQPPPCCPYEAILCAGDDDDDCEADIEPEICTGPCFRCDLAQGPGRLWADVKGIVNWNNGLFLAVAAGATVAMRETDADHEVREWAAKHPDRWGEGSKILNHVGDVRYQLPVLFGVYGYSVWTQDDELHDVTGTVLRAYAITSASATALKFITNTDRPSKHWNNGHYGFPSHHTATSFAIAAVLDEYYGTGVGIPAYVLASAIGFSRIDQQDHDLSDVFFGGAMGFVIGKAVAGRHLCGNSKLKFVPYTHPTDGTPGIGCETQF